VKGKVQEQINVSQLQFNNKTSQLSASTDRVSETLMVLHFSTPFIYCAYVLPFFASLW
jgi:hypothetical protein